MSSATEVCNIALMRIGNTNTISDLENEITTEAIACRTFFNSCRDLLLRAAPWPFASKRIALAEMGTPPANWTHRYALPADCIAARRIVQDGLRVPREDQKIPFEVATEAGQRVLYTDMPQAVLLYTYRVEDLNLWDPVALSALSYLIASEISMPLAIRPELANAARQGYFAMVSTALAAAFNEACEGPEPDGEFITAKGGF